MIYPDIKHTFRLRRLKAKFVVMVCCLAAVLCKPGYGNSISAGGKNAALETQITLRDGIKVTLKIYLPHIANTDIDKFPALYLAGPYGHEFSGTPPSIADTGPIDWYGEKGYAVVQADIRGTGKSGGTYSFLARDEQQDHYEIIEWIAAQHWSNGKIGGFGQGYYATSQWMMAIQNPPHLSCIAPFAGIADTYRHWIFPGGIASSTAVEWYEQAVRQLNGKRPANISGKLIKFDLSYQQLAHPNYDSFWQQRSAFENLKEIKVPVLSLAYASGGLYPSDNLSSYNKLQAAKKLLLINSNNTPPEQLYTSRVFHESNVLPFYDWCLKGAQNAYAELAPIRYSYPELDSGVKNLHQASHWPLENIHYQSLYLASSEGQRVLNKQQDYSGARYSRPLKNNKQAAKPSLSFTSPKLEQALIIAGSVNFELYASSNDIDTDFIVTLSDLGNNTGAGAGEKIIAQASLKASHNERLADDLNTNNHTLSFAKAKPLEPGKVYKFNIKIPAVIYRFKQGNRLRLEIEAKASTLYHSAKFPSRLWLPTLKPGTSMVEKPESQ